MQPPFHVMVIKALSAQRGAMYPYLAQEGLSPGQPKILSYLTQHDQCRQRDLADYYNIEPATVSRLLANMEEKGLVRRESRQGDKRSATVAITDKGKLVSARMRIHFDAVERRELDGFSEAEAALLRDFLRRMYRNLTGEELE
ncbi:MAG: MarR family transcriptional regulator [Oscillospiraceae bacterium]|nr:MarR family transcriptional regulator [Oscillospiraceae bacterium]